MKKNVKKCWFTWHLFPQPKDVPIQSVYEMCFLGIIFCLCVYIYSQCNKVPYCQETIQIECLDNKYYDSKHQCKYIYPKVDIKFRMPCTSVDELKNNKEMRLTGENYPNNYWYIHIFDNALWDEFWDRTDSTTDYYEKYNKINWLADSLALLHEEVKKTEFRKLKDSIIYKEFPLNSNRNYRTEFTLNKLNEEYELFQSLQIDSIFPDSPTSPLYYYKCNQTIRKRYLSIWARLSSHFTKSREWETEQKKDSTWGTVTEYIYSRKAEYRKTSICQEGFCATNSGPEITISDPFEMAIGDPGWFAFEDISQAYYHFNIKSETIDSIRLSINFVGSTEFSKFVPEPDEITMSSIVYYSDEKIKQIKKEGLLFHAKFVELENRQTIRLFFITAIMSTIFAIFISFVVLGLYKIATNKGSDIEIDSNESM